MAHLIEITILTPHLIRGSLQAEGEVCEIHEGVADDLIKRGIAKLTNEHTDDRPADAGE